MPLSLVKTFPVPPDPAAGRRPPLQQDDIPAPLTSGLTMGPAFWQCNTGGSDTFSIDFRMLFPLSESPTLAHMPPSDPGLALVLVLLWLRLSSHPTF